MNNKVKISVIVPIYKAEAYLHRCVDSLLSQTFADFEILLINDGSPDNSGKICEEYAVRDERIKVFHKENGGVSSARQCGIDKAIGEYTIHADPDDWVEPNMLEELYKKALEVDADMVLCDYYMDCDKTNRQEYIKQAPTNLNCDTIISELFQYLHGSCCNKLVKRNCYNKYNVRFPREFNYSEDLYVIISLLKNKLTVSYLPKAFYHYVIDVNVNSLCSTYTINTPYYDLRMKDMFVRLLADTKHKEECENRLSYFIVSRAYNSNVLSSREFKYYFKDCRKSLLNYRLGRNVNKIFFYMSCLGFYEFSFSLQLCLSKTKKMIKRCLIN